MKLARVPLLILFIAACSFGQYYGGGGAQYVQVPFSATPTFTANSATLTPFNLTLTGNVTSSTLSNAVAGQALTFRLCQDGHGNYAFTWPLEVLGGGIVSPIAFGCSTQQFWYNGTLALPLAPMYYTGAIPGIWLPGAVSGGSRLSAPDTGGGALSLPQGSGTLVSADAQGNLPVKSTLLGPYSIGAGANQLPAAAAGNAGWITVATDAASGGDCTVGSGTSAALCRSNGSAWTPLGGGASADASTPTCTKYTVAYNDASLGVAATSATKVLVTLPARAKVTGVSIKTTAGFLATAALQNLTVSLGTATNATVYAPAWRIHTPTVSGNVTVSGDVGTATTAAVHNLIPGDRVVLSSCATTAMNGDWPVATTPTTTTFTITGWTGFATPSANCVMTTVSNIAGTNGLSGFYDDGGMFSANFASHDLVATFASTGANLNALTAGSIDVRICSLVLP